METAITLPKIPTNTDANITAKPPTLPPVPQYFNPIPVVVGLVPVVSVVDGKERVGLLTVKRGIEPCIGKLALPGGYLEYEDWKAGCAREIVEETGIRVAAADISDSISLSSVQNGTRLLIFAETRPIEEARLSEFVANEETQELVAIYEPTELAFPTHTAHVAKFFAARGKLAAAE